MEWIPDNDLTCIGVCNGRLPARLFKSFYMSHRVPSRKDWPMLGVPWCERRIELNCLIVLIWWCLDVFGYLFSHLWIGWLSNAFGLEEVGTVRSIIVSLSCARPFFLAPASQQSAVALSGNLSNVVFCWCRQPQKGGKVSTVSASVRMNLKMNQMNRKLSLVERNCPWILMRCPPPRDPFKGDSRLIRRSRPQSLVSATSSFAIKWWIKPCRGMAVDGNALIPVPPLWWETLRPVLTRTLLDLWNDRWNWASHLERHLLSYPQELFLPDGFWYCLRNGGYPQPPCTWFGTRWAAALALQQ